MTTHVESTDGRILGLWPGPNHGIFAVDSDEVLIAPERLRVCPPAMPTAIAHANIALVKYWGKRDIEGNRPAAGSLSLTLAGLDTRTRVERLGPDATEDVLILDGAPATGRPLERVRAFVDRVRQPVGAVDRVRVESRNDFPTAAGLASSASAFAALAVATAHAFEARLDPRQLSVLARTGSGSAARSIFGGYAEVVADDDEPYARPLDDVDLDLGAVVCVVDSPPKETGSTDGMELTRHTSPYHAAWLEQVSRDLYEARHALQTGDFERLAAVTEGNCLAMHANAMSARPGLLYFAPATLDLIRVVRRMRTEGTPVFFTIDAGPHVVAFTRPDALERVAEALKDQPGVREVRICRAGAGARIES